MTVPRNDRDLDRDERKEEKKKMKKEKDEKEKKDGNETLLTTKSASMVLLFLPLEPGEDLIMESLAGGTGTDDIGGGVRAGQVATVPIDSSQQAAK